MATFWDLVTLVKFHRYFRRVVTFGIPCETSHAHDFVSAKSHAREKPLLAEYSDQFGIACYVYHFPHFLQKKKLHFVLLRWRLSWGRCFRREWYFSGFVKFYGFFRRVFTFGTLRFIRQFRNERKLGRVHFRKDFWDSYQGQGEKLANS